MMDTKTRKPLRVLSDGDTGGIIRLPVSQVDEVRQVLEKHKIRHWVHGISISFDEGPETTIINLGRTVDVPQVQAILDDIL